MKRLRNLAVGLVLATAAMPALAQQLGSDGERLLTAVRDKDGNAAANLIEQPGSQIVNYRGYSGDTALTIVTAQRSTPWVGYLLSHGADPNLQGKDGNTPLIIASRMGFREAVDYLLRYRANPDATNKMGETALIVAVQQRQLPIIRTLLEAGANPDKADHSAGLSARDYAKRDSRTPEVLRLIDTVKSLKKAAAGPKL